MTLKNKFFNKAAQLVKHLNLQSEAEGRRRFIRNIGIGTVTAPLLIKSLASPGKAYANWRRGNGDRATQAYQIRLRLAQRLLRRRVNNHRTNRDERDFAPSFSYTKVLFNKDAFGEVVPGNYQTMRQAIRQGRFARFENTVPTGAKGLKNPLAAHAYDLKGFDSSQQRIPAPPSIRSPRVAAEMAELYWQALCRDIPFSEYGQNQLISEAANNLSFGYSDGDWPLASGGVSPSVIFRGSSAGELVGPYVSQFLYQDIVSGTLRHQQKQTTALPGSDWMTNPDFWNFRQRGGDEGNVTAEDPTPRYIRNGRDLASYVQIDRSYQPYLNAFYVLYDNLKAPYDGNPYTNAATMDGFSTFDYPHIMTLLAEVSNRALRAAWFQKWIVHRRIRPEEFGGRVHFHTTGARLYPMLNDQLTNSDVLERIYMHNANISGQFTGNGASFLLPQAYPEGSPNHPAYPSGHATIAGACVTVLKAFYNEHYVIPNPMVPNADGTELVPYTGPGAGQLTVGGELNKLAMNIAMARNWAGIHWRSDLTAGLMLGERIALQSMREERTLYAERRQNTFNLTRFNGSPVGIS